jgi:predicted RNA-binding protein
MNKKDIHQITEIIIEANNIPGELLSESETIILNNSNSSEFDKEIISKNINERIKAVRNLQVRTEAIFRAILGETSSYIIEIKQIEFVEGKNYSNSKWKDNKLKFIELLEKAKVEFHETLKREKERRSLWNFFRSNEARAIILTAILSLVAGFFSKDFIYDLTGKVSWSKLGSSFPNFEVIEFKRTVDLREWTPTVTDNENDLSGKAIYDDNFIVRKIRDEGKDFCLTAGSSGSNPDFTSHTHKIKQTSIDMHLEGWPNLKNQALAILDVSKEKSNSTFPANIRSVRYRGFKDEKANWCSVGIWHSTQKLVYRVDFPKGKMGNSFSFSTSFFYVRNNFQKLHPDSSHLTIDSTSLTWTVEHPIIGNAYRIDWNW